MTYYPLGDAHLRAPQSESDLIAFDRIDRDNRTARLCAVFSVHSVIVSTAEGHRLVDMVSGFISETGRFSFQYRVPYDQLVARRENLLAARIIPDETDKALDSLAQKHGASIDPVYS